MHVSEQTIVVPALSEWDRPFDALAAALDAQAGAGLVRFAVSKSNAQSWVCETGAAGELPPASAALSDLLFGFRQRQIANSKTFNAVFMVPTGIGAEIGGHAGDATAAARLIGQSCDQIILHPNVVNASDINEMPANALYAEGSILTRMMMGTIGLQPVSSNRVLAIIDDHPDVHFADAAINTISAARATYGLDCPEVIKLDPPVRLWGAKYTESGRAVGEVRGLDKLLEILRDRKGSFDAVALSSVISVPVNYHLEYFESAGNMVNPWGGVEAMLTHALSAVLDVPTAHAPMFESRDIENLETGIVEPRMSAEAVSVSFLQCVLKGLHTSPRIVTDETSFGKWGVLSAEDVCCLVIPDGCLGLPTLAALQQGIPVIAVRENRNLMENDLSMLPWRDNQFFLAENYLEAAGIMNALKAGVTVESVRRPISSTKVTTERREASSNTETIPDHEKAAG